MADRSTHWVYELAGSTQNSSSSRSSVRSPDSFRMVGLEASVQGPPRPFPGFIEVHRLPDPNTWSAEHDESSMILDLFSFNIIVGDSDYAFGFVFRAQRKNGSNYADIYIVLWDSLNGEWYGGGAPIPIMLGVPVSRDVNPASGKQMSVSFLGRLLYVFVEDQEPALVEYPNVFNSGSGFSYNVVVRSNTGPGMKPTLLSPKDSGALGSITTTGDANRPGAGQVFLTEFLPNDTGLFPTDDYGGGTSTTGGATGTATTGGSGVDQSVLSMLKPGDYAFCFLLYNSQTGRRSALSEVAQARKEDFDPDGPLTTASSGTTGGAQDPIPLYAAIEICYDTTLYDQAYIYRSVRVQDAGGTYIATIYHLDKIINLVEYATTNNPLGDPTFAQSVYWYELEDKQLAVQSTFGDPTLYDENMPRGGASLWYENTMLVSSIKGSSVSSSEEVRKDDGYRGVGELRWSSLLEVSPELFPPSNRYYPPLPSNDIVVMKQVGPNVIGFSRDRQYVIRKEGAYLRPLSVHEGFGVANEKCVDSVGSLLYFLNEKGMKSVDSNAQLDDVLGLNQVVLEDWRGTLGDCSVAFDPAMSVLFAYNRSLGEMACFWFNTAQITMIRDLPFREVVRGSWPSDFQFSLSLLDGLAGVGNATYYNPLVERAFFVQNPPKNSSSDAITGFRHRIFMVDYRREKEHTPTDGATQTLHALMPTQNDVVFPVNADFSSGVAMELNPDYTLDTECWGYKLYVLEAEDTSLIGKCATIGNATSAFELNLTLNSSTELHGLVVGDLVGLTPVYVRWEGAPVTTQDEEGNQYGSAGDMFKTKYISSISCCFSDVEGPTLTSHPTVARFTGLVYRGNRTEPTITGTTINPATQEYQRSITEDEGIYSAGLKGTDTNIEGKYGVSGAILTPAVTIICPGASWGLVGVLVEGSVKDSKRTGRVET